MKPAVIHSPAAGPPHFVPDPGRVSPTTSAQWTPVCCPLTAGGQSETGFGHWRTQGGGGGGGGGGRREGCAGRTSEYSFLTEKRVLANLVKLYVRPPRVDYNSWLVGHND